MALETASGAFAAVGVADVLIRVGRDIYSFLCDVADAPDDLKRLNEHINDNLLFAEISKECLQELSKSSQTTATANIINSLGTTLRALNRELQSLSRLIAKYIKTKTWNRIKYVLDERKVGKALESLERTKSNLASILTLACRQLSASNYHKVEALIEHYVKQIESAAESRNQQTILTLKNFEQTISSIFDSQNQQVLAEQSSQSQSLVSLRKQQSHISSRQRQIHWTCTQNQKKTNQISRAVAKANEVSRAEHQKTRDFILDKLQEFQIGIVLHSSITTKQKRRKIQSAGLHLDMIMTHLREFISIYSENRIPGLYLTNTWFLSEAEHILGSAAQEMAARSAGSTATPFDEWSYCEIKEFCSQQNGNQVTDQNALARLLSVEPSPGGETTIWVSCRHDTNTVPKTVSVILAIHFPVCDGGGCGYVATEARNPWSYIDWVLPQFEGSDSPCS